MRDQHEDMVRAGRVATLLAVLVLPGCRPASLREEKPPQLHEPYSRRPEQWPAVARRISGEQWSEVSGVPSVTQIRSNRMSKPNSESMSFEVLREDPESGRPRGYSPSSRGKENIAPHQRLAVQDIPRLEDTNTDSKLTTRDERPTTANSASESDAAEPRSYCNCSPFDLLGLATSGIALAALGATLVQQLTSGGSGRSQQPPLAALLLPDRLTMALRSALVGPDHLLSMTCRAAEQTGRRRAADRTTDGETRWTTPGR